MKTAYRIKRLKEIYNELYESVENGDSSEHDPSGVVGLRVREYKLLNKLFKENKSDKTELINSIKAMDKTELTDVIIDLIDNPMCRDAILRFKIQK